MQVDRLTPDERLDSAEYRLTEIERQFKEAFPNGDYTGHCRYHEVQIEILLSRRRLISAVMEKSLSGLVWGGMLVLGAAIWQYIREHLK